MKKFLITLFAITSVTALAENHVYGKLGADLYSRYNKIQTRSGEFSTSGKTQGFSGMIEVTTDITPNWEVGAGLGFIHRSEGKSRRGDNKTWKTPKYDTIPLYALAKYNFDTGNEWKPYVKADLGIAFNDSSSTLEFDWFGEKAGQKENKLDVKNGLYIGTGVGVEYHNFLAELSYRITTAKANGKYSYNVTDNSNVTSRSIAFDHNYNNHAITLSVGYKFNF